MKHSKAFEKKIIAICDKYFNAKYKNNKKLEKIEKEKEFTDYIKPFALSHQLDSKLGKSIYNLYSKE